MDYKEFKKFRDSSPSSLKINNTISVENSIDIFISETNARINNLKFIESRED